MNRTLPLPIAWAYINGYTFRWARGTSIMTVQREDQRHNHDNNQLVAEIPVPQDGWKDTAELQRYASRWLLSQTK